MSKLVQFISIATIKSFLTPISTRRAIGIFMLVAALAFSGCAMSDQYTPIAGPSASPTGFGGGSS